MPRENLSRNTPRHVLSIVGDLPPHPGNFSRHAAREMADLCRIYRLHPGALIRVLVECLLDACLDEPGWIEELVDATRCVQRGGLVPGCWLQEDDGDTEAADPEETAQALRDAWAHFRARFGSENPGKMQ